MDREEAWNSELEFVSDLVGAIVMWDGRKDSNFNLSCGHRGGGRALAAELNVVRELANEIAAQPPRVFLGDAVFPGAPCGGGMLARQKMRTNAE